MPNTKLYTRARGRRRRAPGGEERLGACGVTPGHHHLQAVPASTASTQVRLWQSPGTMLSVSEEFEPSMSAFLRSLPRPVQGLLGLALFAYPLWQGATVTAPTLITDWAVRDTARPVPDALVTNARCTNTNVLLQLCSMAVTVNSAQGRITRRVGYAFMEPHLGPWSYRVLVDPARPYWPTTTLGMDALLDRTICLFVMLLTCLPLAAAAVLVALGLLPTAPVRLR